MLGEGNLALNYTLFCAFGSFGALQCAAGKYSRRDLTPLPKRGAQFFGIVFVAFAFVWFFTVQPDLFIPGLAGGEFVVYSFVGFVLAYTTTRVLAWLVLRVMKKTALVPSSGTREPQSE